MASGTQYVSGVQQLTSLAGTENVTVDAGGAVIAVTSVNVILGQVTTLALNSVVNNATAASTTLLATDLGNLSDCVLNLTGGVGGSANAQLPTFASVAANLKTPIAGHTWRLRIRNVNNNATWTVTTNTGWSLVGTMTIATGTWRDFFVEVATDGQSIGIINIGGGSIL